MNAVRDDEGTTYLLLKRSHEASLVRDPATGTECYIRNDRLEAVDESPLDVAVRSVPQPVRTLLSAVHDDRTLGFLLTLADRGATDVRTLLSITDFCESDLHGRIAELTAAGLLEEARVGGERGYRVTRVGRDALALVRADRD